MKTTLAFLALPFLSVAPLTAQDAPGGPGQELLELFEKMHREGATEDDLRKMLQDRSHQSLIEPEAPREHAHDHGQPETGRPAPETPTWKIGLVGEPVAPFIREHLGLEENVGLRVVEVADGSPAARAGIEANDIIVSAGDKKISNLEELKEIVARAGREGQPFKLGWIHKGERKGAQLRPDGPPPPVERKQDKGDRAERAGDAPERPAMMRRMEEMARRMERQQREIEELRREIEKLKREARAEE
jgi:membrane-associated protease RseP (regulator of RpoE activity)